MKAKYLHLKYYVIAGLTLEEVHNLTGVSKAYIKRNFSVHFPDEPVKILGSKTETYYTEEELLKEITYSYEDLSDSEKEIYNNRCEEE